MKTMHRQWTLFATAFLIVVAAASSPRAGRPLGGVAAGTVADFDNPGTAYAVVHGSRLGSNPALPVVTSGGPTGNFLRLATQPAYNLNTIAFDLTDPSSNFIQADFDFRMIPPAAGRQNAADGLGFVLLNSSAWGTSGGVFSDLPEFAALTGSLGVGFRIFPNANTIFITFGSQLTSVDVTPVVDLASGQFIHARILMRPGGGFSDVTVILTPPGGSPTTVVDRYVVPGFTPYAGRAWFGARSGGLSAEHDLDNINLQFSGVQPVLPFVSLLKDPSLKFVSYSPTNFNPNRDAAGHLLQSPTSQSITQDLLALLPGFKGLILYGTQQDLLDNGQPLVPWIVSEARRLGFRAIVLGVWNPKDNAEVDAAAALVTQYGQDFGSFAVALCVGNEGILRGEYGIAELDLARARVLSQLGGLQIPIVTSEDVARYDIVPALKGWGSFLFPIIVPHWNVPAFGPVEAAAWVRARALSLADQALLPVLVKEAGFPSGGAPQYTPETQRQFFAAYVAGPSTVDSSQFPGVFAAYTTVLEAYDQAWKLYPDFTTWGLLTSNRTPKPAFHVFSGSTESAVHLDGDSSGDAFAYRASSGQWVRLLTMPGGGVVESAGGWDPGWSVLPATFDGDTLTDFFLSNATTGQWFKMINTGSGFSAQATSAWWPGWQKFVMDLDGDGLSDLFLYDPVGGQWFKCISTPAGFTNYQGAWNAGWDITPLNLNADGIDDLFLINRTTGRWFWVLGQAGGGFTYPQEGYWYPGWKIYPGDFTGDGRSDLLLHEPANGQYYVAINTGAGFTYQNGVWALGWTPYVIDLDGNGAADLFLHNKTTGQWYQELGDGLGHFSDAAWGAWIPGWDLYPTDFNGDNRTDLLLYNPGTGQWFQAWNYNIGQFGYFGGYWVTGLTIVVGTPGR